MKTKEPAVGNFKQICRYVQGHTEEALLHKAFEYFAKKNNIALPEKDFARRKAAYAKYLENAYVGKFKSQFVGGGRLEDSVPEVKQHLDEYIRLYNILSDEQSKLTLYYYLHYYLFLDMDVLNKAYVEAQQYYQPDILPKREHQVLVDCGAYDGDTVMEFIKSYGEYDKIYAYEPDPDNYEKIKENLAQYQNITAFNRAVSDSEGEMRFTSHMSKAANRFNPAGDKIVPISTIDHDIDDKITFLKMDIESAEPNALLGARRHITEDKPDMAICVYHTISDLRTIPFIIYDMNPNQKFYLRHHKKDIAEETVFYAHPED